MKAEISVSELPWLIFVIMYRRSRWVLLVLSIFLSLSPVRSSLASWCLWPRWLPMAQPVWLWPSPRCGQLSWHGLSLQWTMELRCLERSFNTLGRKPRVVCLHCRQSKLFTGQSMRRKCYTHNSKYKYQINKGCNAIAKWKWVFETL